MDNSGGGINSSDLEWLRREISKVNELRHQFWTRHRDLKQGFLAKYPAAKCSNCKQWKDFFSLICDMEDSLSSETAKRMQNRRSQGIKHDSGLYATKKIPVNPEQALAETERKVHHALRSSRNPETGCTHIDNWRQEAVKQEISPRDFTKAARSLFKNGLVEKNAADLCWSTLADTGGKLCEVCCLPLSGRQKKFCSTRCKQVAESRRFREKNPEADQQSKLNYLKYITGCDK